MPLNNSGNRERTPLSTRSPRLARLTKSKLPPPNSKSIPHPAFEFRKAYRARSPCEPLIDIPVHTRVGKSLQDLSIPRKPQLLGPVAPERGFNFRIEVSNNLRRPTGQSPVDMNRAPGRFSIVVCKGASEFEPDRFVMRRNDHQFIFSRIAIDLRLPEQKRHGHHHAERNENRNERSASLFAKNC